MARATGLASVIDRHQATGRMRPYEEVLAEEEEVHNVQDMGEGWTYDDGGYNKECHGMKQEMEEEEWKGQQNKNDKQQRQWWPKQEQEEEEEWHSRVEKWHGDGPISGTQVCDQKAPLNALTFIYGEDQMPQKSHDALHLPQMLERFGSLASCFVHEQRHIERKRFANDQCNSAAGTKRHLMGGCSCPT